MQSLIKTMRLMMFSQVLSENCLHKLETENMTSKSKVKLVSKSYRSLIQAEGIRKSILGRGEESRPEAIVRVPRNNPKELE